MANILFLKLPDKGHSGVRFIKHMGLVFLNTSNAKIKIFFFN